MIDKLIERIDKEIIRSYDKLEKGSDMKEVLRTNIQYLKEFRKMAVEVKEGK